jgi:uncharacterized damage-inducible protein DinB
MNARKKVAAMGSEMHEVYGWVKATRHGLLEYCASVAPETLAQQRPEFGLGSMAGAMLHIAGCYQFWLARTLYGRSEVEFESQPCPDAAGLAKLFAEEVDPLVEEVLTGYPGARLSAPLAIVVPWQPQPLQVSPLWLLTHVITHEFHHKGQVVAYGRILGYPPPETDLAGPSVD